MSGGLRHHNDEENGPSHAVGYKSSKKQDSYSLERNQCVCAVEEVCPDLQKPEPKSLDRTGVVRDVVNRWDEFCMAHGDTTINENGICWQYAVRGVWSRGLRPYWRLRARG